MIKDKFSLFFAIYLAFAFLFLALALLGVVPRIVWVAPTTSPVPAIFPLVCQGVGCF